MTRLRVAVLASGAGSNLQALLDACTAASPAEIALVLHAPGAGAADRARSAGIPAEPIRDPADGTWMRERLRAHGIEFVVLAGYLKLVPRPGVDEYRDRMATRHHALLPACGGTGMYGRRVHAAVLASGATVSGPTVHLVSAEYDRGGILAQWPVPVRSDDTPESLRDRVLAVEHQLLPAVVLAAARAGGRAVRLVPSPDLFSFAVREA